MRKLVILLLLTSAAASAFAAPRNERDSDVENDRSERTERSERAEPRSNDGDHQRNVGERPQRAESVDRPERSFGGSGGGNAERSMRGGHRQPTEQAAPVERPRGAGDTVRSLRRSESGDTVRNWRSVERRRDDSPAVVEQRTEEPDNRSIEERNVRRLGGVRRDGPLVREVPTTGGITEREVRRMGGVRPVRGTQAPVPSTARRPEAHSHRDWSRNWRHDRRYDWSDWRRRNRSRFHLSFYLDPFGWDYQRFGIGWRLWPSYYSSRYWLNDPWYYRLPPAYGPYRWVRYHHDALLVNIYTGQVADVVYNFFW